MKTSMLVRLKPHDPKKGLLLKQYTYQGIRFQAGRGWVQGEWPGRSLSRERALGAGR
jgi:hypothetical protein